MLRFTYKFLLLLFAGLFLISFNSCYYNIIYKPTSVKPTFFAEKGDFNAGLNFSATKEVNAAYAISDKFAVSASVSAISGKADTFSIYSDIINQNEAYSINSNKFNDFEIAFAYYKPLSNGFTIENYIGYSYAFNTYKSVITDVDYSVLQKYKDNTGAYSRYFIQPAIGKNGKYFDYGIASRITLIDYLKYNDRDLIFEQLIFTRLGYKRFKFMFEFGFFFPALYSSTKYDYSPIPIKLGFGLNYVINSNTRKQ